MLKHWSETPFGDFILQQECKMIRQAMLVSAAQSIVIVLDKAAVDNAVYDQLTSLADRVRQQSRRPINIVFAEISDESAHVQGIAQGIRAEYLTHLINCESGEHIESSCTDWVILSHAIESTHAPRQVLREATRVLTDGGRLSVFAFSPMHYLERALWRKISHSKPSVKTEISRYRVIDWMQVLNFEITSAQSFISSVRSLSAKFRQQQLQQEHVKTLSWFGVVYHVDALKRDMPVTSMRIQKQKKNLTLRLASSAKKQANKNTARAKLKLAPVTTNNKNNH